MAYVCAECRGDLRITCTACGKVGSALNAHDQDVIDAAIAYVDQLGAFNKLDHPEVQSRRKQLAEAVSARFESEGVAK